jgi:hypothetical protein
MNFTLRFLLIVGVLVITVHRAPAPISEESPTPAPEQSVKPKPKRTIKPKVTSESSESSTKRQAPSPSPKVQATPTKPRFAGTWNGIMDCGIYGQIEHTMTISQDSMTVWQTKNPSVRGSGAPEINGDTIIVRYSNCYWTLTPTPDGKTALTKCGCEGFFGIGTWNGSAIFHRTSP